jgi:hypothetical protein
MAKINTLTKSEPVFTHGGARASRTSLQQQLERSVLSCLLWEDAFYESGEDIAARITNLVKQNSAEFVSELAIKAREEMKLRHVPLLLVREMARNPEQRHLVASTLERVIQRADELTEFLAIYWKDDKNQPLAAQVKKGLARAFGKFDEFALSRYNRDADVKLRDVLFLTHAKPSDASGRGKKVKALKKKGYQRGEVLRHQTSLFTKLVNDELKTADTWETELSAGKDKKATFERLIAENKLGALALLRNLRGMTEAKVDRALIIKALQTMKTERVLPFRFISAAKYAKQFEPQLEEAMFRSCAQLPKLKGRTVLVIDISGSMHGGNVSRKSELTRIEAANALAMLVRETAEDVTVYATAGDDFRRVHATDIVPARRGFALSEAIWALNAKLGGGGIFLKQCMDYIAAQETGKIDRVIVFTDEQDCDQKCRPDLAKAPGVHNYIINVSSEKNGIAYGKWTHITGWSEAIVRYITELEQSDSAQ